MSRPTFGIATDGAHSTKERLTRFRAVDLSSAKELFSESIGNWTNNIGEFLGIIEAVKYILSHPQAPRIIYSDSITAITWYWNKKTASSRRCPALLIAEVFLKVMAVKIEGIQILHWDNKNGVNHRLISGTSDINRVIILIHYRMTLIMATTLSHDNSFYMLLNL